MEVHSLVKEKLRLKGINLNSKNVSNTSNSSQVYFFFFFLIMIFVKLKC